MVAALGVGDNYILHSILMHWYGPMAVLMSSAPSSPYDLAGQNSSHTLSNHCIPSDLVHAEPREAVSVVYHNSDFMVEENIIVNLVLHVEPLLLGVEY